ncbi:hypothetical protein SLEP1_g41549 [Rubroshorea leprosula]|uniref:Uncharacterized protein n=1 Tax=Rubroshorea leprosula TaxID=152421 RepID=A0AAV5L731_9ROSI|nr:hypothetical protein SLEP1_g41549 [Rubroshorea leprosula]
MWASPFTRRVELALKRKGIPYEYIEEDISNKSPLLLKYNSIHKKVPVLVHNQKPIIDSLVILEDIDETWKNNPILPQDPHDRALSRFWAKFIDEKLLVTARKIRSDQEVVEEVIEQLKILENELTGKEFFGGDKIGNLDIVANVLAFWFIVGQEFSGVKALTFYNGMRGRERASFYGRGARGGWTAQQWESSNLRRWNRPEQDGKAARLKSSWKSDIRGIDRRVFNQTTAFFFTNFPEDWRQENMWQTFCKYGRVLDIYSPMRKNKMGSRFGFVRYLDVRNERELEIQLDQIRVGSFKLWVNRPRFEDKRSFVKYNQGSNDHSRNRERDQGTSGHRTFAEVVKGNSEHDPKPTKGKEPKGQSEHLQARNKNAVNIPAQVWKAKDKDQARAGMSFTVQEEEFAWLQGCYVGSVHSIESIPTLQEKFFMEGYFSCRVRAMGGRLVLLEGGDKEEIKDLIELAPDWMGQWFKDIKPWNSSIVAKERFVWLRCQGVPVHAWGHNFFEAIGSVWGNFITLDDSTSKKQRFDIGRMLISTPVMDFISKSITARVNGEPYTIKVMEEEATNGIFSMKSDHVFNLLSDSEKGSSESWSLNNDSEVDLSGASVGCKNTPTGEKEEEEAVAGRLEPRGADFEEVQSPYRWIGEDGKIQANRLSYQGESKVDSESVLGNLAIKTSNKMNIQSRREQTEPHVLSSPVEHKGTWAKNKFRPLNGLTSKSDESDYSNVVANSFVEDTGPNQPPNEMSKSGTTPIVANTGKQSKSPSLERLSTGQKLDFWKGFESESGEEHAWMGRNLKKPKHRRRKKTRSCRSIYMGENKKEEQGLIPKGRKQSTKEKGKEELVPKFSPGSRNQAAGESLNDSGIENRNICLRKATDQNMAERIWAFAKEIGVGDRGNENEVIRRLEDMENRDREMCRMLKGKKSGIREIIASEKVEFISIQESKMMEVDFQLCKSVWGADNFDWVAKPSRGTSGGLICIWNNDILKKEKIIEGENFVGVHGFWGASKIPVYILNVYAPCDMMGKRTCWSSIKEPKMEAEGKWCLMGDFNAIRNQQEWNGGRTSRRDMADFDEFIRECGLVDLPLIGRKFTWYQANGAVMSRLDRFLLSEEWCEKWDDMKQWGLKRTISDHCPILMKNQIVDWGPKPFRFFDMWLENPECKELMTKTWNSTVVSGWHGFQLKEKLKATKIVLKEWSKNKASEIDLKINMCKEDIAAIDLKGEEAAINEQEVQLRRNSFLDLWKLQNMKESMWRQKARKTWIRNGDANTKFFHRCVKGRRRRNEIVGIQVGDNYMEQVNEIKEGVANHFENLFKEDKWQRPHLDGIPFKKISTEDNRSLVALFSEDEVKRAVWSCGSSKAPGPDGFNFKFIREMWETIKSSVMGFIDDFHRNGKLDRGVNSSFIVLIPKVTNPQKIEEFRPISLIGVMYKVIAKLLANRISLVLDNVIGESQSAFIRGRHMVDSIVIANETIDEAKRKKMASFMFKMDFEKAYDKVCWDFLDNMMMRMDFDPKWRRWITACLESAEMSILINGSTTRQFKSSRGLRQGDPLSPYLFLLVAEGLNGIISSAINHGLFEGIDIGNGGLKVSHLQFADDSILFGKAVERNIWAAKRNIWAAKSIMRIFELVSGLKINFVKSQLFSLNVSDEWKSKIAHILHCKQGAFPCRYLGVPIGSNNKSIALWKPLIKTFEKKLSQWKGRFLSFGGRITLLNAVLTSLPVFSMSVHLLPRGLILSLDKIRRNFLWGGGENKRKINWVAWDKVCKSKKEGGLGVKDLRNFNFALLGKWWSRLARDDEGLVYKVIHHKYGRPEGGFKLNVGEGCSVNFWKDKWTGDQPLANRFPRLFLVSTDKDKRISQMGTWKEDKWQWTLHWRRSLYVWEEDKLTEMLEIINSTLPVKGQKDCWEWRHNKEGEYSVKTAYGLLSGNSNSNTSQTYARVWNKLIPTKICAFGWQVLQDRIPTKLNLYKRGIILDANQTMCSLCGTNIEDTNHLFIHCSVAYLVRSKCAQWWRLVMVHPMSCQEDFQQHRHPYKNPLIRTGWDVVWFSIMWSLWMARNAKIFKNQEWDVDRIVELVQLRSFNWIKGRTTGYSFNLYEWMLEPALSLKDKRAQLKSKY